MRCITMRRILALVLLLSLPAVTVAGDNGYKVIYDGGSLTDTKTGAERCISQPSPGTKV